MKDDWRPTHRVYPPNPREEPYDVYLDPDDVEDARHCYDELDDPSYYDDEAEPHYTVPAYSRGEWDAEAHADLILDNDAWYFQGEPFTGRVERIKE